jgi:hypothetical protein
MAPSQSLLHNEVVNDASAERMGKALVILVGKRLEIVHEYECAFEAGFSRVPFAMTDQ